MSYGAHGDADTPSEDRLGQTCASGQGQYITADPSDLPSLWAKTDKKCPGAYHPVLHHFADVANVARLLWQECLGDTSRSAIESDAGFGDRADAVVAFLAGMHDLGKASPGFQFRRSHPTPHGTVTARELKAVLADNRIGLHACLPAAAILAQIAGAHHGVFAQAHDIRPLGWDTLGGEEWTSARTALAALLWRLLNDGSDASGMIAAQELLSPASVPLLAGLISVADWIGSNTDYFHFDSRDDSASYFDLSTVRAHRALTSIGWLPAPTYAQSLPFEHVFGFVPNQMQQAVIELISKQTEPFLLAIEAQMGQGKTEAALYAADRCLCDGRSRGMYIALPTQATSDAMFGRVKWDYLRKRGHSGIEDNLQLVHGNALLADVQRISGVSEDHDSEESTVSARSWFTARKRPLLAPFGVGTIDQALLSVLQTRHWFVRLFGLANKVVVFDEVHAYDTYTSTLLDHLVRWLSALDCTVIILSATLPRRRLSQLVEAYSGSELTESPDYPRITLAGRAERVSISAGGGGESKHVPVEFAAAEPSKVANLVRQRLSSGGCAAVVCNTVDRAQTVYMALRQCMDESECLLFHARTPFAWRKETEDTVLRKFGKPNENGDSPHRPHRAVVVATQVIEQSLDLDFDWVLTDMAPIDLILQRLGREHRHKRGPRPVAVNSPVLTILSDDAVGGAPPRFENAGIYERHALLRSWLAVTRKTDIRLPDDIDLLVQWVYGNEQPSRLDADWTAALEDARIAFQHEQAEHERKAKRILVPNPGYPEDIIAQFNKQLGEDDDPSAHESVKAATRDGEPSIQVVCLNLRGDKLFPACGTAEVNLASEPDAALTKELLGSSLSIQKRGLYRVLLQQPPPRGWRRSPHLRFHRVLAFVDCRTSVEPYRLSISRDLGLVVTKETS